MTAPLLVLDHDWHRSRAHLRGQRMRPPPLVAAGCDLVHDAERGRSVAVGGLAVIFGTFPATVEELRALAKSRLHLGEQQARELDAVFSNRLLAVWAWLPTRRQDLYLEYDRATGEDHLWLIGPGEGQHQMIDPSEPGDLDDSLLEALVLNGAAHWGGAGGLARLVERHGRQPPLVAAQVADHLEHHPRDPAATLDLARTAWPWLSTQDEAGWATISGNEHPWVQVQLGRLALRLGMLRAARLLLSATGAHEGLLGGAHIAPIALFDLAQACEALDDVIAAEQAFARYVAARNHDADAWRRLLFCRLRLGRFEVAEEGLRRYRGCGGKDEDLALQLVAAIVRGRWRLTERANVAGFLAPRLATTAALLPETLIDGALRRGPAEPDLRQRLRSAVAGLPAAAAAAALLTAPVLAELRADDQRTEIAATIAEVAVKAGADSGAARAAAESLVGSCA